MDKKIFLLVVLIGASVFITLNKVSVLDFIAVKMADNDVLVQKLIDKMTDGYRSPFKN